MTEELPAPFVAAEVDLTGMPFMPLDVQRLLDSELWLTGTGEECKAAVSLWCKAWQQRPAASLPDNDKLLAAYSGAGARWKKVKAMALHAFVKCSDGRLYHPVVAEKALDAWQERLGFRERTRAANEARKRRHDERLRERDDGRNDQRNVNGDNERNMRRDVNRDDQRKPDVTTSKGQGQGQGQSPLPPAAKANGHTKPPPAEVDDTLPIVRSFHALKEEIWNITAPPDDRLTAKELSVVRAWVEDGVEYYPALDFMTRRMKRMSEKGEQPPERPQFFDKQIREAKQAGWPGYKP